VPAHTAILVDTADHLLARIQSSGIDLDERARVLIQVAERLTAPEALEAVQALLARLGAIRTVLESGILDPSAVRVVARAGRALSAAAAAEPAPVGAWGALRAVGEPAVQQALGFLLRVARDFGQQVAEAPRLPPAAHLESPTTKPVKA
jgi:uncharacterized protein YjgD (DUF1641 family)